MAKTYTAAFAQTPQTGSAVATAASVITTDSATNTVLLATAGADGAILSRITAAPRATVTATALYLFVSKDAGTTFRLKDSMTMPAATLAGASAVAPSTFATYSEAAPLRLSAGDRLYVSIGVALAAGVVFSVEWVDF